MTGPHYSDGQVTVWHGDCLDVLRTLPAASVDAVCTDPPYGLEFMGKEWDAPWRDPAAYIGRGGDYPDGRKAPTLPQAYIAGSGFQQWCEAWAVECLRVLKPGGHLLAFGGTRTWHRLACAVEDAGFEVRDSIAWLYGSGFPKSLDVSKAIDRAAGADREVIGPGRWNHVKGSNERQADVLIRPGGKHDETAPATDAARQWQGWGTALKPAFEPIVVARRPLAGTVAANVLQFGTGALNVDGCRIHAVDAQEGRTRHGGGIPGNGSSYELNDARPESPAGRWPANVVLDGHTADHLDQQTGNTVSRVGKPHRADPGDGWGMTATGTEYDDSGGASRFFPTFRYEPKAPTAERPRVTSDGGAHIEQVQSNRRVCVLCGKRPQNVGTSACVCPEPQFERESAPGHVAHPTVKPLDLMRWLVRLVTPPGGTVLDPFAGSGTTGEACIIEGARAVLIEREATYLPLIVARLSKPIQPDLFGLDPGSFGAGADERLAHPLDDVDPPGQVGHDQRMPRRLRLPPIHDGPHLPQPHPVEQPHQRGRVDELVRPLQFDGEPLVPVVGERHDDDGTEAVPGQLGLFDGLGA